MNEMIHLKCDLESLSFCDNMRRIWKSNGTHYHKQNTPAPHLPLDGELIADESATKMSNFKQLFQFIYFGLYMIIQFIL